MKNYTKNKKTSKVKELKFTDKKINQKAAKLAKLLSSS